MTIAISIATSAKYHEAINIIEIDSTTPKTERNLKKKEMVYIGFFSRFYQ